MDLRQLRYFLAVVEAQGFRAASRSLHVSQPPLTRAVHELETELGVTLLDRGGGSITPTRAGALLARHARRIFASIERAREEVGALARPEGRIRVAHVLPEYLAEPRAARALAALRRRRHLEIDVAPMLPRAAAAAILAGGLDVAFVFLPLEGDTGSIEVESVLQDELVAAIAGDHPLAASPRVSLVDVARERLVLFPRRAMPERHDEILGHFSRARLRPAVDTVGPSLRAALLRVAEGGGVSVVPRRASAVHVDIDVVLRPIREVATLWTLAAITRPGAAASVQALVRTLRRAELTSR
ncbi:MAG: LysR family transcriptional regulator [Nannocystaceae bacterium]